MKKLRIVSALLVIVLMGIFIILKQDKDVVAKGDEITINLINGNELAGNVTIAVKQEDNTYADKGLKVEVLPNTKLKFYFADGLNDGYSVYAWAIKKNDSFQIVKVSNESDDFYQDIKFVKTVNEDLDVYVFAKKSTDHIITFYDSSVASRRNVIGLAIANEDGKLASTNKVDAPVKKGFDFQKWSLPLKNITSDMEIYPLYDANVISVFRDYCPLFLKGLGVTLLLSVVSVFCALFLGCAICLIRMSKVKTLKIVAGGYVEIIRGVPLLLQLLLIYCLLGPTKISLGGFFTTEVISCVLTLFINSSAYVSEIFRSGIQAVDKGQMEAGRALGMSSWQVMRKIVLPQGIKNSLPSIGNELIMIIKETSLAVSIDASIGELMCVRKSITAATYINLPPYIIVAIIYFIVTFSLSKLVGYIEKRLASRD